MVRPKLGTELEGEMENYIVRIYRRSDPKNPRRLIGLVEEVGVEGQRAFRNLAELWAILNPPKELNVKRKKPKGWIDGEAEGQGKEE
jgi:hypothetical protein